MSIVVCGTCVHGASQSHSPWHLPIVHGILLPCTVYVLHLLCAPTSVGVPHVVRRLDLRRKLQTAVAQSYDDDNRARQNACPSTLQDDAANEDVDYDSLVDSPASWNLFSPSDSQTPRPIKENRNDAYFGTYGGT